MLHALLLACCLLQAADPPPAVAVAVYEIDALKVRTMGMDQPFAPAATKIVIAGDKLDPLPALLLNNLAKRLGDARQEVDGEGKAKVVIGGRRIRVPYDTKEHQLGMSVTLTLRALDDGRWRLEARPRYEALANPPSGNPGPALRVSECDTGADLKRGESLRICLPTRDTDKLFVVEITPEDPEEVAAKAKPKPAKR